MKTVEDLLRTKEPASNTIEPTALVIDALKKLIAVNLSYLIVFENEEYLGIFCERDYTRKLVLHNRSSRETMVREVMTTDLQQVSMDDSIEDCMYQMNRRGARYLSVFDEGEFVGIVTIHDLLRQVLASKGQVFDDNLASSLLDTEETGKFF